MINLGSSRLITWYYVQVCMCLCMCLCFFRKPKQLQFQFGQTKINLNISFWTQTYIEVWIPYYICTYSVTADALHSGGDIMAHPYPMTNQESAISSHPPHLELSSRYRNIYMQTYGKFCLRFNFVNTTTRDLCIVFTNIPESMKEKSMHISGFKIIYTIRYVIWNKKYLISISSSYWSGDVYI